MIRLHSICQAYARCPQARKRTEDPCPHITYNPVGRDWIILKKWYITVKQKTIRNVRHMILTATDTQRKKKLSVDWAKKTFKEKFTLVLEIGLCFLTWADLEVEPRS